MNNNKNISELIVLRNKLVTLNSEIAKTQKKLNAAQSESLKATYAKQLKQLEALKKDVINRIAVLSMVVDIDPNTFVQHGRKRR